MSNRGSNLEEWVLPLTGILGLIILSAALACSHAAYAAGPQTPQAATKAEATNPQKPEDKAWGVLGEALKNNNAETRARAVRALGLLLGNMEAEESAVRAFKDDKPNVRLAAAAALGSMHAEHSLGELEEALGDSEPGVVLAAANSLLLLHDDVGYDTYYEVLTGERRASKGLIKKQMDTLKDKKKMAEMGFEEGIGFIPFAGIGYEVFKTVTKNDSSPLRAAAAKKLATDPEPDAAEALVKAAADKSWAVRAAALEAIAQRGDLSLIPRITGALDDDNDVVRFTAAACVVHLSGLPSKTNSSTASKP